MSTFSLLLLSFFNGLPWVAIALMSVLALRRRKDSKPLMLQAVGAAAAFVLALGQWFFVDLILLLLHATPAVVVAARDAFGFLLFIALATFAVGYCAERLALGKPAQVTATPA